MKKNQTAGHLVIQRLCLVVFKKKKVSCLDLFILCVQGQQNGQRLNFFIF